MAEQICPLKTPNPNVIQTSTFERARTQLVTCMGVESILFFFPVENIYWKLEVIGDIKENDKKKVIGKANKVV